MTCNKLAGLRTLRHDHVQSSVQYGATAAGHRSSIEPQERQFKGLQYVDSGYGKRGKVLFSILKDVVNVDLVITYPASESMRSRASKEPGAAARVAATRKQSEYASGGARGHQFVPYPTETYGRLGNAAVDSLR